MPNADGTNSRSVEILEIAREQLATEGLDKFVMRRVADLAGMKLGNLQYYFPTRDDLLEAILRAEFAKDLGALKTTTETNDPQEELDQTVRLLTDRWLTGTGNVYVPIGALALHHDRFERLWAEIYGKFYSLLGQLIERIDPTASATQVKLRATLITSLIDGATIQPYEAPAGRAKQDIVREIERLTRSIAKGAEET